MKLYPRSPTLLTVILTMSALLFVGAMRVATEPVSLNPTYRALALAQGLKIGSAEWTAGGLEAFSGNTGGQPAYGWDFESKLTEAWARAVISNYSARPAFYLNAPARNVSYLIGSRPLNWSWTSESNALPDGSQTFDDVAVSGPDLEHFALAPLFTVAGGINSFTVEKPGQPGGVASSAVALDLIRGLMAAQAGMLRKLDGSLTSYVCTDRPARYIVGNLVAARKLGAINAADDKTISDYIQLRLLPRWLSLPVDAKGKGSDLQVYNQVCWAVPAMYELAHSMGPSKTRALLWKALQLQCSKLALLQSLVPGKACQVDMVATWYGLKPEGVKTLYYYGPWEVRSMLVAGEVLGLQACTDEGLAEAAKWKNDPAQWPWLVDPSGVALN